MRTKQSAIRRVANSEDDDEEGTAMAECQEAELVLTQPKPQLQPQLSVLATTVNSQGQQLLEDGTVVVQPEAAESLDEGAGCFVDQAAGARSAPGIYDTIKCTACGKRVNPYNGTMEVHPMLKVLVCNKCYKFYDSGHFDADEEGKENQCRWCGEGGSLICCDNCEHSFCRTCIKRNLGRSALQDIESLPEDSVWLCYACDQGALRQLQEEATIVMKAVRDHFKESEKRSEKHKNTQAAKKAAAAAAAHAQQHQQQQQQSHAPHLVQLQNIGHHHQPQQIQPRPPPPPHPNAASSLIPLLVGSAAGTPAITAYSSLAGQRGAAAAALPTTATIGGLQLDLSSIPKVMAAAAGTQPVGRVHQVLQSQQQHQQQHRLPQQQVQHHLHHLQHNNHQQPQPQQQQQQQASVTQRTEQWYKQNVRVETILADIESVDERSIGTALNATVSLLQGMMRQYSRFMQDLTAATTQAERAQVVGRFKSAYRMHLFLRLGKLRTLIAEEDKHLMRKSAARTGALPAAAAASSNSSAFIDLTGSAAPPSVRPPASASLQVQLAKAAAAVAAAARTAQFRAAPAAAAAAPAAAPAAAANAASLLQQRQRPAIRQTATVGIGAASASPSGAAVAAQHRPRPPQPQQAPPPPELVVVLSDDDDEDDENNNKDSGGGAAAADIGAAASPASPSVAGAPATAAATANGGKPAAILELLEARRRREKCSRKTQQPRRIAGPSAGTGDGDPDGSGAGGGGGLDVAAPMSDPPHSAGEDHPSPSPSPATSTGAASAGAKRHADEFADVDSAVEAAGVSGEKRRRCEDDAEEEEEEERKSLGDAADDAAAASADGEQQVPSSRVDGNVPTIITAT